MVSRCGRGLKYIKCEIYEREQSVEGMDVAGIKNDMVRYHLMLPCVYSKEDLKQNFAIMYDNREMDNHIGMSEVPYCLLWTIGKNEVNHYKLCLFFMFVPPT